jgi:hypothetical protein
MEQNIIYTIRIKIVAMRFRTKLNAETLTLSCTLGISFFTQIAVYSPKKKLSFSMAF